MGTGQSPEDGHARAFAAGRHELLIRNPGPPERHIAELIVEVARTQVEELQRMQDQGMVGALDVKQARAHLVAVEAELELALLEKQLLEEF